jgi:type I restriction enzyme S subunit
MGEWNEKHLSDLANLYNDSWKVGDEECPYIALEHIEEGKLRLNGIGHSDIVTSNKYRFNEKNFLFGKLRPYFRKVVRPQFSGICSTDIWVVGARGETDLTFLFYLFANQDLVDLAYSGSSGTRMPRADWKFMKDTAWLVPSDIEEQRAIASVLSSLDDKIDLLHRQNQTLEAMAETLFRQWFVEEAEEGWEEKPLFSIAEHKKYNVKPNQNLATIYRHYSIPAFDGGKQPIKELGSEIKSNKYKVVANSILISKLNPRFPRVWAITDLMDENSICSTEFQVVYPTSRIYYGFAYYLLKSKQVTEELIGAAGGTSGSHQRVKPEDIFNLSFQMPPDERIEEFNLITSDHLKKVSTNIKQISALEKLRDTLLPKLMSGEVRVEI